MIVEEWHDIIGYEGYYKVNNLGIIKSIARFDRNNHFHSEKILKQRIDKYGYFVINLCKDGMEKTYKVHRIVAQAFIPNPNNLPEINHKNEIKSCNYVDNLEWCSTKYNANYGTRPQRISAKRKGRPNLHCRGDKNYFYGKHFRRGLSPSAKQVKQYMPDGQIVAVYDCTLSAAEAVGVHRSAIAMACRGERKLIKGYIWKYAA